MLRILFWFIIWIITLCSADITANYQDGLTLTFTGWVSILSRKINNRRIK